MSEDRKGDDEASPGRDYSELYDRFQEGVSPTDGKTHIEVRASFLEALMEDPRVGHLLSQFIERMHGAIEADVDVEAAERVGDELAALGRRFLVEELDLRWPWVFGAIHSVAQGMIVDGVDTPAEALPPKGEFAVMSPDVTINGLDVIKAADGIPIRDVYEELERVASELRAIEADMLKSGRRGKALSPDAAYLRALGRWYYEARVMKPPRPIVEMVVEFHALKGHHLPLSKCKCQAPLETALVAAERLLNLGYHTL